jgi:hypothetical protein
LQASDALQPLRALGASRASDAAVDLDRLVLLNIPIQRLLGNAAGIVLIGNWLLALVHLR